MITAPSSFRLVAATGLHRGDRPYQQDQVEVTPHPRAPGCLMAVVADGMGGKSGGRKAADQVILTARQVFERYEPGLESSESLMTQLVQEAHLMIKLTALASEADPPLAIRTVTRLEIGDALLPCADGLWHYFTPKELGAIVHTLPPREAAEMLVGKARYRARAGGDNLSPALVRVEALA